MNNEELKKKIVDTLIKTDENIRNEIIKATEEHRTFLTEDNQYYYIVADALIAAEIGDVKEAEHRAKVLGRTLAIMKGKGLISGVVDDYIVQAEKELAEEEKNG